METTEKYRPGDIVDLHYSIAIYWPRGGAVGPPPVPDPARGPIDKPWMILPIGPGNPSFRTELPDDEFSNFPVIGNALDGKLGDRVR